MEFTKHKYGNHIKMWHCSCLKTRNPRPISISKGCKIIKFNFWLSSRIRVFGEENHPIFGPISSPISGKVSRTGYCLMKLGIRSQELHNIYSLKTWFIWKHMSSSESTSKAHPKLGVKLMWGPIYVSKISLIPSYSQSPSILF